VLVKGVTLRVSMAEKSMPTPQTSQSGQADINNPDRRWSRPVAHTAASLLLPCLILTLAGMFAEPLLGRWYLFDLAANLAVPIAAAAALAGGFLLLARRWRTGAIAIVAALGTCAAALLAGDQAVSPRDEPETLRVLTYNARLARHDERFVRWVLETKPHILCFIEADGQGVSSDERLRSRYRPAIERQHENQWQIVMLSRIDGRVRPLVPRDEDNFFSFAARRSFRIRFRGVDIAITAAHPASPRSPHAWRTGLENTGRDGRAIAEFRARNPGAEVIVLTDMNAAPTGLNHRVFARESRLTGWASPLQGTWPSVLPPWLSIPIDRVWTSDGLEVVRLESGPRCRSDHRPVYAELRVRGDGPE